MRRAVYPGSFDPVTNGHLDIIKRASKQFDEVIVGVLVNSKKTPLFSIEERVNILKEVTSDIPNIVFKSVEGLSVNFVRSCDSNTIIRGLRAISDFEYELHLAQTNRILAPDIDTMFLITSLEYAFLSSSTVKEVAMFADDSEKFVHSQVEKLLRERIRKIEK